MRKRSGNTTLFNEGALRGEPEGRAPILGTPKDMPSKALEIGMFQYQPHFGERSFARAFERRVKFHYEKLFDECKRHVREGSGKGSSFKRDHCWATWRGMVYWDFSEAEEGGPWKWSICN